MNNEILQQAKELEARIKNAKENLDKINVLKQSGQIFIAPTNNSNCSDMLCISNFHNGKNRKMILDILKNENEVILDDSLKELEEL